MTWAIKMGWRFEPMEVVKETAKMVFYIDNTWNNRETRATRDRFFDWRGDKDTAVAICAKLTSAKAERERREAAARAWYNQRRDEIFAENAAQGDAA